MKKILFIGFYLLLFSDTYSQASDSIQVKDFRSLIDSMYGGLDSNLIPTKILMSRVPFSEKINYANGSLNDSVHNYIDWCFYYSIVSNASLKKFPIQDFLTIDSISESIVKNSNTIPLGVLNYRYNLFKDSVFEKNLVVHQGICLSNGPGSTTGNTYSTKRLVAFSPLVFHTGPGTNQFILNKQQVFSNDTDSILHYEVSINEGTSYQPFYPGVPFSLTFAASGSQLLLFRIIKYKGDTLYAVSSIYVTEDTDANASRSSSAAIFMPDEAPVDIYTPCNSGTTYGRYAIWYGCGNTSGEIRKPIIISTGFNPAKGKALELSGLGQILYPSELPSIYEGWRGLFFETYNGVRNHFSLTGNYGDKNGLNFMQNMIARGFDIIILQYINPDKDLSGVDYVEYNACVLEEMIKLVNYRKTNNPQGASHHENIVVGYSAGALGARYALTNMENQHAAHLGQPNASSFPNHHTRIWISNEGENQGSNTPIGLQVFTKFMKEINISYSSTDIVNRFLCQSTLKILNTPIARQNTYYHESQLSGPSITGPHPDFNATMTNFVNLSRGPAYNMPGYPLQCRRIGMSGGSGIGNYNDVDINVALADYNSTSNPFATGAYTFGKQLKAYFVKYNSGSIVFNYNLYFKPLWLPQVNFWVGAFPKNVHVSNAANLDNCAGSLLASNHQLFDYFQQNFFTGLDWSRDLPQFCPTGSALDLHDPNNSYQVADRTGVTPDNLNLLYVDALNKGYNTNFGYPHIKHPTDHYLITPYDAVYAIGAPDPDFRNNQFHVEDPQVSQGEFLLDEIAPRHLRLSNRTIGSSEVYLADFEALDTISAGYNVYTTNLYTPYGDFVYGQYGGGEFKAGKQIKLKPGFSSKDGSVFRAYIDQNMCDYLVVGRMNQHGDTDEGAGDFYNAITNTLQSPLYTAASSTPSAFVAQAGNSFAAYPNPAGGNRIVFSGNPDAGAFYDIRIYNTGGQLVQQIMNVALPYTCPLDYLKPGLYNVIFTNERGSTSLKFIKE